MSNIKETLVNDSQKNMEKRHMKEFNEGSDANRVSHLIEENTIDKGIKMFNTPPKKEV